MKIVIGLDGSPHSLVARDLVAGLHWPEGSVIHLVGAYQVPLDWSGGFGTALDWLGELEGAMRDELTDQLRKFGEPLEAAGMQVGKSAVQGRPADVILAAARDVGADLVVVGSRGRGTLGTMLLGSVAAEVAAHATCPVLVARQPTVSRLLVATDGSETANATAGLLGGWGSFAGLAADALAVDVPDSPAYELMVNMYTLGDDRLENQREAMASRARDSADRMAAELSAAGIPAVATVRRGDASDEIVAAARERGADLVIVGSRGLTGIDRLLLGSVARNVLLHVGCSVLIVRKGS